MNFMKKEEKLTQSAKVTHLAMPGLQGIATSRTYKDSLFRVIYSGKDERSRKWLLSLYNALSGKNYTNTGD